MTPKFQLTRSFSLRHTKNCKPLKLLEPLSWVIEDDVVKCQESIRRDSEEGKQ